MSRPRRAHGVSVPSTRAHRRLAPVAVTALALAGVLALPQTAFAEDSATIDFSSGYELGFQQPGNPTTGEWIPEREGWLDENGWISWSDYDWALVENKDFPASGLGDDGVSLRFSNSFGTYGNIKQLLSPLIEPAGEPSVGAVNNTFEASFTIASTTGALQERLALQLPLDDGDGNRGGGVVHVYHGSEGLQFSIGRYLWDETAEEWAGSETRYSEEFPVDVAHQVRIVAHYVTDGPDRVQIFVDDALAVEGGTYEGYHAREGGNPEHGTTAGIMFRAARALAGPPGGVTPGGAETADLTSKQSKKLEGEGFLFTDLSMRSYNVIPATSPASLPSTPGTPTKGTELELSESKVEPGEEFEGEATGFLPGELVGFTYFSTPTWAGYAIADADGVAKRSFTPSSSLSKGLHTLQATGVTSGRIATSQFEILELLPATGADTLPMLAAGGMLLAVGAGLVLATPRRRYRMAGVSALGSLPGRRTAD